MTSVVEPIRAARCDHRECGTKIRSYGLQSQLRSYPFCPNGCPTQRESRAGSG